MNRVAFPQGNSIFLLRRIFAGKVTAVFFMGALAATQGQTNYQRLRSFGFPQSMGSSPRTAPIEARDGRVYGTVFLGGGDLDSDGGGIFRVNKDGTGYTLIHRFSNNHDDVSNLPAPIIEGSDGALYGVTAFGGSNDVGTVFKLKKDGSGFAILHSFIGTNGDGKHPGGAITEGRDGVLYGTASGGGNEGGGLVFKVNKDGSDYTVVQAFSRGSTNVDSPVGHVVEGRDGLLYGASSFGGADGVGTVFRLNNDGTGPTVLHSFSGSDGIYPLEIVEANDGVLYGTTHAGGDGNGGGVVFKVRKDGTGFVVLHNFGDIPQDAVDLYAGVIEGNDGALYGASYEGGLNDMGTIFRISKDGIDYRILRSFDGSLEEGECPYAGIGIGSDGTLYGATNEGGTDEGGTLFRIKNDGSGYWVLHNFALIRGGDGSSPQAQLIQGTDGALYGTTLLGGSNQYGTVFKLNRDGSGYTVLVNFSAEDGGNPRSRLLEASDGQLYGTTVRSGSVFRVKTDGSDFTALHHFTGYPLNGLNPFSALLEGGDGALYGTTTFDGTNQLGTVYRLAKDGARFAVIHRFTGLDGDGAAPRAGLMKGTDGALYGTTFNGGSENNGTIFKVNETASGYSVLHQFRTGMGIDGRCPAAEMIQGNEGVLYGTTTLGGSEDAGTVFKLNTDGTGYAPLHSFSSGGDDAQQPSGCLIEGPDGALYGVTSRGGAYGSGTVFKMNKDGSGFVVIHSFVDSGGDGATPISALMRGGDGALYGTASEGGDFSSGIVFRLFSAVPQITIAGIRVGNGSAVLDFSGGAAGQNYQIEASTSVGASNIWKVLGSRTAEINGRFQFIDSATSGNPARFYRSAFR